MTKNSEKSIVTSFQLRTKKFSFLIRYLLLVTCYSLLVIVFLVSCSPQKERTYRKTKIVMDTLVAINVVSDSDEKADKAMDSAFGEIENLDRMLNFFSA